MAGWSVMVIVFNQMDGERRHLTPGEIIYR